MRSVKILAILWRKVNIAMVLMNARLNAVFRINAVIRRSVLE